MDKAKEIAEMNQIIRDANNDIANLAALYIDDAYSLSELTHMFETNLKIIKAITFAKRVVEEAEN